MFAESMDSDGGLLTFTNAAGVECCDNCGEPVDDCECRCVDCGDRVTECACPDGPTYPAVNDYSEENR